MHAAPRMSGEARGIAFGLAKGAGGRVKDGETAAAAVGAAQVADDALAFLPEGEEEGGEDADALPEQFGRRVRASAAGGAAAAPATAGTPGASAALGVSKNLSKNLPPPGPYLPLKQHVTVAVPGAKAVTALALSPSNAQMAVGALNAEVSLWDFNGMRRAQRPFRAFSPVERHEISALAYSCTGGQLACAAGDAVARLYFADGRKLQETVRGDMYIRDPTKTLGHTHAITDVRWHPTEKSRFMTSSLDGTVRVFDVEARPVGIDQALPHVRALVAVDQRNVAAAGKVGCVRWAPRTATFAVAGLANGALHQWALGGRNARPSGKNLAAHDGAVTGLAVFGDELRVASRAEAGTLKLWDLRKFQSPVREWVADGGGGDVVLSPNEELIVTAAGSTVRAFAPSAEAAVFDASVAGEAPQFRITRLAYGARIDQLAVGCSDGDVRLFFDEDYSTNGALLFRNGAAKVDAGDGSAGGVAAIAPEHTYNMEELPPGFKETLGGGIRVPRKFQYNAWKARGGDAGAPAAAVGPARTPGAPAVDFGSADKRAPKTVTGGAENSSQLLKPAASAANAADEPLEAIRAFRKAAEEEPVFVTPAYSATQPKPVFDDTPLDAVEESLSRAKKCHGCGLKLCRCNYLKQGGPPTKVQRWD